jgi:D-alanine-D-alanine ligase
MKRIKVALIYGGANSEHEVSIVSARSVMHYLDKNSYEVLPIYITQKGQWRVGESELLDSGKTINQLQDRSSQDSVTERNQSTTIVPASIKDSHIVFPLLHGKLGEDGTIQGMLEMLGIPYVGSKVLASAMCMDKDIQKQLCAANNIPIVPHIAFTKNTFKNSTSKTLQSIEQTLAYPLFVKPAKAGSSVGVSKARNRQQLEEGITLAFEHDTKVVIEQAVPNAREIECSVLGNETPEASVLGEIIPHHEFYDYEAKYIASDSESIIPADLPNSVSEEIRAMAIKAFQVMQCSGLARVDFLVDRETNEIYLNELNTMPGFTPISMYPKLWKATGLSYSALLEKLISLALDR